MWRERLRLLWARFRRWLSPPPIVWVRDQERSTRVGAKLTLSSSGIKWNGWLGPDGRFIQIRSKVGHSEIAKDFFPDSPDPERELERLGWVKYREDRTLSHEWIAVGARLTDEQRQVIEHWHSVRNRPWPDWLKPT